MKFKSLHNNIAYSTSQQDPNDIFRKFVNSFSVLLPQPSAMFNAIDVAALLICEVNPYFLH